MNEFQKGILIALIVYLAIKIVYFYMMKKSLSVHRRTKRP